MMRCCNLKIRAERSSVAPRLLLPVFLLMLAANLTILGLSTVSQAQFASNSLPEDVADTKAAILEAAEIGTLEAMGVAIELNELPPEFGGVTASDADPVRAFLSLAPLKSRDGTAKPDVEALFQEVVAVLGGPPGQDGALFVWPAIALRVPGPLTDAERQSAAEFMNADMIAAMDGGRPYPGLRIDIGRDGTWHFIGRNGVSAAQ